jgi:hypothetical protein
MNDEQKQNPLEKTYAVALFQSIECGYVTVWDVKESMISGYVRISEPVQMRFQPLSQEEVLQSAVAAFDAEERKAREECNKRVAQIRERKAQLLALTYQPASVDG